jgi:2-oxoglutarate ferredoxin oxidoreductase subunit alpha
MGKVLMTGNEALAEGAILAGCRFYFGYPITPQNEIPAYMARRMPQVGGFFLQAESEIAAINMVLGAAVTGARAMTSSSSPGISLKQEGISYLAALELPAVIVNIVRGGPGLGNIQPAQSDYFQATRGGGHGDYRTIVLAPSTVQEMADFTMESFDLADLYRIPVIILADGLLGQMMEPLELRPPQKRVLPPKTWALTGAKGRPANCLKSLFMAPGVLEEHNWKLFQKQQKIREQETKAEIVEGEGVELVIVAYGTAARICKGALRMANRNGKKVGLIRPITLWPFPEKIVSQIAEQVKQFLVVEMSLGQMVEDVKLALNGKAMVHFYGRPGGAIPSPEEIYQKIETII